MFHCSGIGVKITQENRNNIIELYLKFGGKHRRYLSFYPNYYMGYDKNEHRFKFFKNPNTVTIVVGLNDFEKQIEVLRNKS